MLTSAWTITSLLASMCLVTTAHAQRATRLAPPNGLDCARDQLTVYSGEVSNYKRQAKFTELVIRTEWNTVEKVRIAHVGASKPEQRFLMNGRKFTPADWPLIEVKPGTLRAGQRAAAWVCSHRKVQPVIDWTSSPQSDQ